MTFLKQCLIVISLFLPLSMSSSGGLKYNYKLAQASIKKYASLQPQYKTVYSKETSQKTSDYYKSRKEAILRKHKQK